jgi:CSLREA domain-containing protein
MPPSRFINPSARQRVSLFLFGATLAFLLWQILPSPKAAASRQTIAKPVRLSANSTTNFASAETFYASSAFSYDGRTYGSLTLDGSQTYDGSSSSNGLFVRGNLTIATGSTLKLSNTTGTDLTLLGDITVDGTLTPNGGTVLFESNAVFGSATQTIKTNATFDDVSISKTAGSVKLAGTVTINGALQFDGTGSAVDVLDLNQNSLNLNGTTGGTSSSVSNGFKGDLTGATLNIGGSGALGTLTFISGSQLLKSLSVDRSSSGTVTLGSNLTIGNASVGSLTLTNGVVNAGSNTLSLAAFPTITRTNGYVIGNLQKTFGSTGSFTFTIGTTNGYSPVDANVTAGTGNSLTVKAVQGKHPNIVLPNALLRYWTIANSGSVTANLTFNYFATDVVGTEANYKIYKYSGSFAQFAPNTLNTTSHFATLNGVSSFSDWTLADPTLTVNTTVDADDGACTDIGTGNGCTLREAINAANSSSGPNTINFSFDVGDPGCSGGVCTISLATALPDIATDMTITGTGASSLTVKRSTAGGTPQFRIFTVASGKTVTISGLTVANGNLSSGNGGGLANGGTLTMTNCNIFGSTAPSGGGGVSNSGSLILNSCNIGGTLAGQANAANAGNGGGILNLAGTLTINGGSIVGNSGGGIVVSLGSATLNGVAITNNTSSTQGGGIGMSPFGTANIVNCVIAGNTASTSGGGIFNNDGTLNVINSTISGNSAAESGGGISYPSGPFSNDTITLTNDTITNNRSDSDNSGAEQGGGISRVAGTVRLKNTIVASNFRGTGSTADDINGTVDTTNSSFNLIGIGGSGGLTSTNNNQVGVSNPGLGVLATNGGATMTHALLPGSPAIDAGDNCVLNNSCSPPLASAITTDQRDIGFNRSADGNGDGTARVDIGAYEMQSILVTNTNDTGAGSLRQAITDANANPDTNAINFQSGLTGNITLLTALPDLSTSMSINGPGVNQMTVQRSTAGSPPNFRIFTINIGKVVNISGLTIANGNQGAITNTQGTLTINNCVITGNSGSAAVSNSGATLTINDSTISNNTAGGVDSEILLQGPNPSIPSFLTINNSTISGNSSTGAFGGIQNLTASNGLASAVITNSTISGNTTSSSNGVAGINCIAIVGGTATLVVSNSTVFGNNANGSSGIGGISQNQSCASGCTVTVKLGNTIVAGNLRSGSSPNDISGSGVTPGFVDSSSSFNLIGTGGSGGLTNGVNNNQVGVANPGLGPLANNGGPTMTHALLPGSPAINAGSNANLPADTFDLDGDANTAEPLPVDQRGVGFARIVNTTVDIGAVESRGFTIAATGGTPQSTSILTAFGSPLTATVSSPFGEPVEGGIVTFTAPDPNAGPSATFPGSTATATATINNSGVATSPTLTANTSAGSYNVVASMGTGLPTASFALTNKASTLTKVTSSLNPSQQGQPVTFTAEVSAAGGAPTGTVQFKDGGVNIGSPQTLQPVSFFSQASISTSSLTAGTHTITAEYSGSATFNPSTETLSGGQVVTQPSLTINDVSATEGDTGTKTFTFTVTLSAASNLTVTVDFATANGTTNPATAGTDYVAVTPSPSTLTFSPGQTAKTITVIVNGDPSFEPSETFFVNLTNPVNTAIADNQGLGTIVNDDAQGGIISFSQSNYSVGESSGFVSVTVNRTGDTSAPATVDYATSDGTASLVPCSTANGLASSRCDFTTALGTLRFAAGETSETFTVLISQDTYVEGPETLTLNLTNLTGGAVFGANASATLMITDDASEPATNPADDARAFVIQHYHDFLNREPDQAGLDFWTNQITSCGNDSQCIEVRRINVSVSFFLSIEFQETGYLVERLYKSSYGDVDGASTFNGTHPLKVPVVRLNEFLSDSQQIGQGVIVGQGNWQQQLETNKQAFIADFVQRTRFTTALPASMTAAEFVDALNTNAGNPLSQSERDQLVNDLSTNAKTRAQVLRAMAEHPALASAEFNRAFVLMQFFGYLRRSPNDPQDSDYTGYDFWLTKLNQFNGNYINAEMVKAFITSIEYRQRFGP